MAVHRLLIAITVAWSFAFSAAQSQEAAVAPAPPSASDGTSIDQGIAYVLMLVALVLTYLIHTIQGPSSSSSSSYTLP